MGREAPDCMLACQNIGKAIDGSFDDYQRLHIGYLREPHFGWASPIKILITVVVL